MANTVLKMADDNALAQRGSTVLQAALRFRPTTSAVDVGGLLELQRWSPQSTLRFKRGGAGNAVLSAAAKALAQLRILEEALSSVNVTIPGLMVLGRSSRAGAHPLQPIAEDVPVRGGPGPACGDPASGAALPPAPAAASSLGEPRGDGRAPPAQASSPGVGTVAAIVPYYGRSVSSVPPVANPDPNPAPVERASQVSSGGSAPALTPEVLTKAAWSGSFAPLWAAVQEDFGWHIDLFYKLYTLLFYFVFRVCPRLLWWGTAFTVGEWFITFLSYPDYAISQLAWLLMQTPTTAISFARQLRDAIHRGNPHHSHPLPGHCLYNASHAFYSAPQYEPYHQQWRPHIASMPNGSPPPPDNTAIWVALLCMPYIFLTGMFTAKCMGA